MLRFIQSDLGSELYIDLGDLACAPVHSHVVSGLCNNLTLLQREWTGAQAAGDFTDQQFYELGY